jgi:hypothetical protein
MWIVIAAVFVALVVGLVAGFFIGASARVAGVHEVNRADVWDQDR